MLSWLRTGSALVALGIEVERFRQLNIASICAPLTGGLQPQNTETRGQISGWQDFENCLHISCYRHRWFCLCNDCLLP